MSEKQQVHGILRFCRFENRMKWEKSMLILAMRIFVLVGFVTKEHVSFAQIENYAVANKDKQKSEV